MSIDINQTCPPNQGFQIQGFGGNPICFDISTDADFTGDVVIMITYDDSGLTVEEEEALTLEHFNPAINDWEDITDNVDTAQNKITGTTSEFSFFAIFSPATGGTPVGGELILLDSTSLLLAGAQMNAAWLIPIIISSIGIAIVISRKF